MAFWDGTRWISDDAVRARARRRSRTADWLGTLVIILGAAALVLRGARRWPVDLRSRLSRNWHCRRQRDRDRVGTPASCLHSARLGRRDGRDADRHDLRQGRLPREGQGPEGRRAGIACRDCARFGRDGSGSHRLQAARRPSPASTSPSAVPPRRRQHRRRRRHQQRLRLRPSSQRRRRRWPPHQTPRLPRTPRHRRPPLQRRHQPLARRRPRRRLRRPVRPGSASPEPRSKTQIATGLAMPANRQ